MKDFSTYERLNRSILFIMSSFFIKTRVFHSYRDMFRRNFRLRQKCHAMVCVTCLISWWYSGVTYLSDLTGGSRLPLSVRHSRMLLQVCESIYAPSSRFIVLEPCLLISIASLIQHRYLWSSVRITLAMF